jgi:dihydrofolate reductase
VSDTPRLTAILAVSRDGAIGSTASPTGLPWPRLQRDLRRCREATLGKVCIVGRRTYEGLPPLPDRRLVVMTRTHAPVTSRAVRSLVGVARSADVALGSFVHEPEVMVIGGAEVYRALLPRCERILLTVMEADYPDADVRLERPDALTDGMVCLAREYHAQDEHNPVPVTFSEWVRP